MRSFLLAILLAFTTTAHAQEIETKIDSKTQRLQEIEEETKKILDELEKLRLQ